MDWIECYLTKPCVVCSDLSIKRRIYSSIDPCKTIGLKCDKCGAEFFNREDLYTYASMRVTNKRYQSGERLVTFERHPILPNTDLSVAVVYKTFKNNDGEIGVEVQKTLIGEEAEKLYALLL